MTDQPRRIFLGNIPSADVIFILIEVHLARLQGLRRAHEAPIEINKRIVRRLVDLGLGRFGRPGRFDVSDEIIKLVLQLVEIARRLAQPRERPTPPRRGVAAMSEPAYGAMSVRRRRRSAA
jgi:hypothetical protein